MMPSRFIQTVSHEGDYAYKPYTTVNHWPINTRNLPPIPVCKHVEVMSRADACQADISIDAGSYDPNGDAITIQQSPEGPYGPGVTDVTLTVTDAYGESDSCIAAMTVIDRQRPAVTAELVPVSENGDSVRVAFSVLDNCDPAPFIEAELKSSGNKISVNNGQIVKLKGKGKGNCKFDWNGTVLEVQSDKISLGVTVTDRSGNAEKVKVKYDL